MKTNLYNYCEGKKSAREACSGIYHDEATGYAVATDLQILVASKSDYNPEYAGRLVRKDGAVLENIKFPKWQSVVPSKNLVDFSMEKIAEGVRLASNFLANVPSAYPDGGKIDKRDSRSVVLQMTERDADKQESRVYLNARIARLVCALPQEGARVRWSGNRRAFLYENEAEGLICVFMPCQISSYYDEKDIVKPEDITMEGVLNFDAKKQEHYYHRPLSFPEMWLGKTFICVETAAAGLHAELVCEPAPKEKVARARCIDYGKPGEKACVHLHPLKDLSPVEGMRTLFTRPAAPTPHLYKKDGGWYICLGGLPRVITEDVRQILESVDSRSASDYLADEKMRKFQTVQLWAERTGVAV